MSAAEATALSGEEMEALRRRVESRELLDNDFALLTKILAMVQRFAMLLEQKRVSLARLRKMLFGARTEKTDRVVGTGKGEKEPKAKGKGHGRRGAQEYWGARREEVRHTEVTVGQRCPDCGHGNLYEMNVPSLVMWFKAMAPIQATAFACQRMRCSGCGKVFTAPPPQEAALKKYDESVGSMVALLRYGNGMPHFRLAQLQRSLGIPLPASVQWQLVRQKADSCCAVIYQSLTRHAAQGQLMLIDDTKMRILQAEPPQSASSGIPLEEREDSPTEGKKATHTTAIVSTTEDRQIVVYATGRRQAGENMDRLLSQRESHLPAPIQMCDALAHNLPKQFQVILANCTCHARRRFVEIVEPFPREVEIVLYIFECLYANEETAQHRKLSPQERLDYHQLYSGFLMEGLRDWMQGQMARKHVEPNSVLGQAFSYMIKHWEPLTLFLRVPGAPLDNNECERILKRAIMHRKNSLFYKTFPGAEVGDIFMSIIATCVLNKVNPFRYLTEVEKHAAEVREDPESWLPWNYLQRNSAQPTVDALPP